MKRLRLTALFVVLVCGTAMLAQAGIDRDEGYRPDLGIPVDSSSEFEIGMVYNAFQTRTATVPVYMHTANAVTYIENRIYWVDSDLDYEMAAKGSGLPTTATLTVYPVNDSTIRYEISDSTPFFIPAGEPIVDIDFEVGCIGWNTFTPVKFVDDDNYNFYVTGGQPKAALRDDGGIRTDDDYWCYLYGNIYYTYSGKQNIVMDIDLYQEIPAKLEIAKFTFDTGMLHVDSVTVGDDLVADINVTVDGCTVTVDVLDAPVLPPTTSNVFKMYVGLENHSDDFVSMVPTIYGERYDECGVLRNIMYAPGQVRVPNHTADVDLGDVSYYTTATYYDVWFRMDSNFPVNDYEFLLEFPDDGLTLKEVVTVAGYTAPLADTIPGDPGYIMINNRPNTNYDPSDLPAIVFKLRFEPITAPPAGTVFDITFCPSSENEVRYDMDAPFGFHTADLTTHDGSITIKSTGGGGGGGCPALWVWNGSSFELENTILAECADARVDHDVTDYYLVTKPVALNAGSIPFQIREDGEEVSTFSDFRLMVVDHPENEKIQVTKDGRVIKIDKPFSIAWAKDHMGADILDLISVEDKVLYSRMGSGWFDVSFGKLKKSQIKYFTASEVPVIPKDNVLNGGIAQSSAREANRAVTISVMTADGSWQVVSREDPRREPVQRATVIDPKLIDPERELILRYSWESGYEIDVIDYHTAEPLENEPRALRPSLAEHTEIGSVLGKLGAGETPDPLTLSPGEAIDLVFDANSLPPMKVGTKRDYIFVAVGRYEKDDEEETPKAHFSLDANFPNPFNPTTTIRYSLAKPVHVELRIFDVRGALVRTLVSGLQTAGEKTANWNGLSDTGQRVSSGVYFYQLKTSEFSSTRKMILLR